MTLDKHKLDGVEQITVRTMPTDLFDGLLTQAGYSRMGSAPAQGNRLKAWWSHLEFRRIEVIYSPDGEVAITAYHVD
jgi:hypothetical protein